MGLKTNDMYKPVQHAPRSVTDKLKVKYKAELKRLVSEGNITPISEFTELIKWIVPVAKNDSSLTLCL